MKLSNELIITCLFFLFTLPQVYNSCKTTTPPTPDNCRDLDTPEYFCCYVELESNGAKFPQCVEVEHDYRFALDFMKRITYKEFTNATAKFQCEQTKHNCGANEPKELFQCRKHSSTSKTCCKLTYQEGHSECVLATYKFLNYTTTELFDKTIECGSPIITISLSLFSIGLLALI